MKLRLMSKKNDSYVWVLRNVHYTFPGLGKLIVMCVCVIMKSHECVLGGRLKSVCQLVCDLIANESQSLGFK